MSPPVLPFGSLSGLQGAAGASFSHTARRVLQPTTELADEEVEPLGEPTLGSPICCELMETDWTPAEIAASNGSKTRWLFRPVAGVAVPIGSRWQISGEEEDCTPWTEMIDITGHVTKHGRVLRLFAAVDAALDQ